MSWFSSAPADGEKFHSVALAFDQEALFGPLTKEDNFWLTPSGFITETQVFYATTSTGAFIMIQVIHSSVGVWYPSIQFTFRYVDPSKGTHVFKSTSVTNFVVGPGKFDKRSCKADQFSISLDPATPTKYTIEGSHDSDVQLSVVVDQLAAGWKVGAGPRGGLTYFGSLSSAIGATPDVSAGGDGYAIHRFWPRCAFSGIVRVGTEVVDLSGARGMFIHAIQGMRPNVLASAWNFANFQSKDPAEGVALSMMEFTTVPQYGSKKVNIGSVVVGDKLVAVTVGGDGVVGGSSADHLETTVDKDTGYAAPGKIAFTWQGTSLGEGGALIDGAPRTKASILLDLATHKAGEEYATKGLVEKVDVLAHIPKIIKTFVAYAAGTKPYIYTWLNPVKASVVIPADLTKGSPETKTLEVDGYTFNEATFIS